MLNAPKSKDMEFYLYQAKSFLWMLILLISSRQMAADNGENQIYKRTLLLHAL